MRPGQLTGLPDTEVLLAWVEEGQRLLEERLAPLVESAVAQPSRLPGWTRGHVLAHLARNADALVNLLTWARTGTPTPMYPSADRRNADIEAGAARTIGEQRDDLAAAARRLMECARRLRPRDWETAVQSASGRDIPASDVPWLRAREVWIHLADLDIGVGFEAVPDPVAGLLVHDVARWMGDRVAERVELVAPLAGVVFGGSPGQPPVRVHGTPQALAAWLVGRSHGELLEVEGPGSLPVLPDWL